LAKAGLLVALAHRPELLVLDEPSSGLDPLVRRELLEAVVRSVAEEGRTVLFSSHLLDEIARVSDRVAMVAKGRIVLQGPLHQVLESHRRLVIRLPRSTPDRPLIPGALTVSGGPEEWTVICNGAQEALRSCLQQIKGEVVEESGATFEEVFHARAAQVATAEA
jgi:ABC-2 type transport system ATP-binding protein